MSNRILLILPFIPLVYSIYSYLTLGDKSAFANEITTNKYFLNLAQRFDFDPFKLWLAISWGLALVGAGWIMIAGGKLGETGRKGVHVAVGILAGLGVYLLS